MMTASVHGIGNVLSNEFSARLVLIYLHSSNSDNNSTAQWFGMQTMLEQAKSDVLILLDCCAAASSTAGTGNGVTEVIAACGFETWAPGVGEHSFTRSLIDELEDLASGAIFSAALLHNKVLSRIKYWKPRYDQNSSRERRKTPIYILLANETKRRSIGLAPLQPQLPIAVNELTISQSVSNPSSEITEGNSDSSSSSNSSMDAVWPDPDFKSPMVLISVALEDDQTLYVENWRDWMRSIPALVKFAHIEGILKSESALLLVSIPVAVWDLLPQSPAMSFVGFVRSRNFFEPQSNLHWEWTMLQTFRLTQPLIDNKLCSIERLYDL